MSTLILKLKSKTIVTDPVPPPQPKGIIIEPAENETALDEPQEESIGGVS